MQLQAVYARFFRSLNYDYLRKTHPRYEPDPWDATPTGASYPFVRVSLEPDITTVVGANEAGKSQLLDAIKLALTGEDIERRDFCRYSPFFSHGEFNLPEFGLAFGDLGNTQTAALESMCEIDAPPAGLTRAALFRMNETPKVRVYLESADGWAVHNLKKPSLLKEFGLPTVFEIDSHIPLPDTVPLEFLTSGVLASAPNPGLQQWAWAKILERSPEWFASAAALQGSAEAVMEALEDESAIDEETRRKYELADDLLVKVAGLDRSLFSEIRQAVLDGKDGYAGSLIDTINAELAKSLNFPHWWSQDSFFEVFAELRDHGMLALMVRDRTGRSYSFDERSAGMKYFLSYFVQYLSHDARDDDVSEILLMDEPDAFLSSSGQQDLLRIFSGFAHPDDPETRPVQVVYVTHSPFLIDKNHAERIRVLEKGEHDEGTRVVANAARNHYEPLRSAFGSFVGETTFIGTCNLLLEGPADQVLIAGISSWLGKRGAATTRHLDLNHLTLVPAGGASQVPYLAFLARGRDVDRPPLIVLLDGDDEGDKAKEALARGGPRNRELVAPAYILQVSEVALTAIDNPRGARTLEDLVPMELAILAAKEYCREYAPGTEFEGFAPSAENVFAEAHDTHGGVEAALRTHLGNSDFNLTKVGFARSVRTVLANGAADEVERLATNFETLFAELSKRQRAAEREASSEKISSRLNRAKRRFIGDNATGARREDILLLIEEIEAQLDLSLEADEVRTALRGWQRDFSLDEDPRGEIEDYDAFLQRLEGLPYAGSQAVQETDAPTGFVEPTATPAASS